MSRYIELNRTFAKLSGYASAADTDDYDVGGAFWERSSIGWEQLYKEYRVVILSEAGTGKTEELRHSAERLVSDGKSAFFLRLENIADNFRTAFEVGTHASFLAWRESEDEGWLFLDSVDESRLKHPKDFENAIRELASYLAGSSQRVHIYLSSRVAAWRPKSDLDLYKSKLPYQPPKEVKVEDSPDSPDDEDAPEAMFSLEADGKDKGELEFGIYTLTDLSREQIRTFVSSRGIMEAGAFLNDIERQDADAFAARPQDLDELVEFWQAHKKIGSRKELMEHSIERRLKERDPDRADLRPISLEKARLGAEMLALASVLLHDATIRIPDGSQNKKGFDPKTILADWDDAECSTLLSLPLFDEAIYGAVRFHHRTVREFLAAKHVKDLLGRQGSRRRIEGLFFARKYGLDIIVPSMRHVLSWLVLFDERIRQRAYETEPEILFEGGDPAFLPPEYRREILVSVCKRMAKDEAERSVFDYSAVQRFANVDLADEIKRLLAKYKSNAEITAFLLRMVWHGRVGDLAQVARAYATNPKSEKYVRFSAIRAVKEVGSYEDLVAVLESVRSRKGPHERRLLADLIEGLRPNLESIRWIMRVLPQAEPTRNYDDGGLSDVLIAFVEKLDIDLLPEFLEPVSKLLRRKPVIERGYCEISKRFGWLVNPCERAVERLILAKHRACITSCTLTILKKIAAFRQYPDFEYRKLKDSRVSELVRSWKELNFALFWDAAKEGRRERRRRGERLTEYWQIGFVYESFWRFSENDFLIVLSDVKNRKNTDDRLVALSLAFQLYRESGRPAKWRAKLQGAVRGQKELEERLHLYFHPAPMSREEKSYRRQETEWKRRHKEREKKRAKDFAESRKWLKKNLSVLENSPHLLKGKATTAHQYLHERMRRHNEARSKWTSGNWKSLIPEFGADVARAFRNGTAKFWRNYKVKLPADEIDKNTIPFELVFGLTSLAIEAREVENWPQNLTRQDAELACRYAFRELNGFPSWFERLYRRFPDIVLDSVMQEVTWEIENIAADNDYPRTISSISSGAQWMWDGLAPRLLEGMSREPENLYAMEQLLVIIQGSSSISDAQLAGLAAHKVKALAAHDRIAGWFAVWVGIDPDNSIPALEDFLKGIRDSTEATNFAMMFIVNVIGDRRAVSTNRRAFATPPHLKRLHLLMHRYIRADEDIDRAGKGVYSPGLRDNAQQARNGLFGILRNIPGKETFIALTELAETHPLPSARGWIKGYAKERAVLDADRMPLKPEGFRALIQSLEITPTNHRELFDLAKVRLLDLKDDLENGDSSDASLVAKAEDEPEVRKYIGNWLRRLSYDKYSVTQEEELADKKKPDIRFLGMSFDGPVPVEAKVADNWSGEVLFERMKNQLCGDYLRDIRSSYGIFLLVYRGGKKKWQRQDGTTILGFHALVEALQGYWEEIEDQYPGVDLVEVIGIDLTARSASLG